MPSWRVHVYMDKVFFGRAYPKVHRKMDSAFAILRRNHRVLFHDPLSAYAIARRCYPGDNNAVLAAENHILIDNLCTADPDYRRFLENMELLSRHEKSTRKKKRKPRQKEDPRIKAFERDVKRFVELEKMRKMLSS
jgi:hypothetical protein